jgi:integrase
MTTWKKTRFVGVRYRGSETRRYKGKAERYYSIRYKSHGKTKEEGVGWESSGISPQYCSNLRGEIVASIKTGQGHQSLEEKRILEEAKQKAAESEAINLQQAFENFLKTRDLKDRTIREYKRSMEITFADWKNRRLLDISRDMVSKRHQKIKADALKNYKLRNKKLGRSLDQTKAENTGNAQANLHMRVLRAVLNFSAGYYEDSEGGPLLKHNPVERLSQTKAWYRVSRRQTIIKPDQLPRWYKAVMNLDNITTRDYLLFLLFTGSRRTEGMTIEINQVDLKNRAFTFLDPKNRQPITLPLSNFLHKILKKRIDQLEGFKYVFPGVNRNGEILKDKCLVEPKRMVQKVIEESGVNFTLHDLRRHFITLADSLDISVFAVKRLVNHSMGSDVTSGYVVSDVERLRNPMKKIEDRILQVAKAKEPGKVVPIKSA